MYKMLSNLIKLLQSAAEQSNFKQACKRNDSMSGTTPRTSAPHHHWTLPGNTTIAHLRNRTLPLVATNEPVTGLQRYKYKGSSLNPVPLLLTN